MRARHAAQFLARSWHAAGRGALRQVWRHDIVGPQLAAHNAALLTPHSRAAAGGVLIGGFNPVGWTSQGGDSASDDAFLFFIDDDGATPVKLPKASRGGLPLCALHLRALHLRAHIVAQAGGCAW